MMGWEKKKKERKKGKRQYRTERANTAGDLTLPSVRLPLVKVFRRNVQCMALMAQGNGSTAMATSSCPPLKSFRMRRAELRFMRFDFSSLTSDSNTHLNLKKINKELFKTLSANKMNNKSLNKIVCGNINVCVGTCVSALTQSDFLP